MGYYCHLVAKMQKYRQLFQFFSVQYSLSVLCHSLRPRGCRTPGLLSISNSRSLLKLMPIESVMPFNHLILCCPLLLLLSVFPSIRVSSNDLALCIRWPKYWNFSFSISPFNEYSGLISLRIDWFILLAAHGTLKSLFQQHSWKACLRITSTISLPWTHSTDRCSFQSPFQL